MKLYTVKPIVGSIAMALLLSIAGCTAMTGETAGQNVDDSTITASVKTKLAADKIGSLTRVDVDTTRQVVSLNGIGNTLALDHDMAAHATNRPTDRVGGLANEIVVSGDGLPVDAEARPLPPRGWGGHRTGRSHG